MEQKPTYTLLNGTKKGDRRCQELLYRQFYSYGMGVCLRYTASREEAVEVLNDGFMKVFFHIDKFDPDKSFIAWFRRILINTSINYFRKNNCNGQMRELNEVPDPPDLRQDVLGDLNCDEIVRLIQALPPAYRTVFNLYAIEGYTHVEIARMLHISEGTSKSNLSRARTILKNLLTRNHEEGIAKYER